MSRERLYKVVTPRYTWSIEVCAGGLVAIKENGDPIYPQYLQFNHDTLRGGIVRLKGGWRSVVLFAGYNPDEEYSEIHRFRNGFQNGSSEH